MRGTRHQIVKIGSESDSRPRNHLNSGIVRDWAKIMAIFSIFKMASSGDPILPHDKDRHSIPGGHIWANFVAFWENLNEMAPMMRDY